MNKHLANLRVITAAAALAACTAQGAVSSYPGTRGASTSTRSAADSSMGALGNAERATSLIGQEVRVEGRSVGELENLVVDLESGRVLYAVLDTGNQKLGVPPGVFSPSTGERLELNATREQLRGAPRFTSDVASPSRMGQASFVHQVHQHFGQSAWWQGSSAPDQGSFNNVHRVTDLRGTQVKNVVDANVGQVQNAVVDLPAGRVLFVVMNANEQFDKSSGSFYALPPQAFTRPANASGRVLVSDVDEARLAGAPHFSRNEWSRVRDQSFASSVYRHYGKQAYFEQGALRPTGRNSGDPLEPARRDRVDRDRDRGTLDGDSDRIDRVDRDREAIREQREEWREQRDRLNERQERLDERRERLEQERRDTLNERRDVLNDRRTAVTNVFPRPTSPVNRNRDGATRDRPRYSDRDRESDRERAAREAQREALENDAERRRTDDLRNN